MERRTVRPQATELEEICRLLRERTGHDLSGYNRRALAQRLALRLELHQLTCVDDYIQLVRELPHELELLFQAQLISVTEFFRDPGGFDAVSRALDECIARLPARAQLRMWVAACAPGEEAYSLTIAALERAQQAGKDLDIQTFATDLAPDAIELARIGRYAEASLRNVSPARLKQFFVRETNAYRISARIRERVVFATQDLLREAPFSRLHLVSCRNLLIYLDEDLRRRVFPLFHTALEHEGILWLGPSEAATSHPELFDARDRAWSVYVRREARDDQQKREHAARLLPAWLLQHEPPRKNARLPGLEKTLSAHAVSLLVTSRGDIVRAEVRPRDGASSVVSLEGHNLFDLTRQGLRSKLTRALRRAAIEDCEIVRRDIRIETDERVMTFSLHVQRIDTPPALRGLFSCRFEQPPTSAEVASKERPMLDDLRDTNQELQATIEELQATNEELRSANERLETLRTEMRAFATESAERLAELERDVGELSSVNDDLQRLFNASGVATVLLDSELRIQRFNAPARNVFRLIASDVGRPLGDLAPQFQYDDLLEDALRVSLARAPHEEEVSGIDGLRFRVRIAPHLGAAEIGGVLITFVDIGHRESLPAVAHLSESI